MITRLKRIGISLIVSVSILLTVTVCQNILSEGNSVQMVRGANDNPYPPPEEPVAPQPTLSPTLMAPIPSPTPSPSDEARFALEYITKHSGIPAADLLIAGDEERSYPLTGRTIQAITILDTRTVDGQVFDLWVDLADGSFIEDMAAINALQEDEDAAYRAKYGKFHPTLHERLQKADDAEMLPVAFWLASNAETRTQDEISAELLQRYPEAVLALEQDGTPWAVEDDALAAEIQAEYRQMLVSETARRAHPVVAELRKHNAEAKTYGAMPAVSVRLSKRAILEMAKRDDVGYIYLIEAQGSPETDIAMSSNRAPAVWQRGFDGTGVRVAFLDETNIDNLNCLNIVAVRDNLIGIGDGHSTRVASVAGCDDAAQKGMAPDIQIIDAGFDWTGMSFNESQEEGMAALQWALQNQNADVVNISYKWETDRLLNWTDRAVDYWARTENVLIVKSAGNQSNWNNNQPGNVTSPGKGWNMITVGGSNDDNTSSWADDGMYYRSSSVNPSDKEREKPEVLAPGTNIKMFGVGGNPDERSGTSYAAPQVSGLAALLIDRRATLEYWPTAIKAIIMASAVHNIDGPTDIPTGQDLKDGAGVIDASLADTIAQNRSYSSTTPCTTPCWWGVSTDSSTPAKYGSIYRYFNASRGERVRVALSWWADADTPGTPGGSLPNDELKTNYHLYIQTPTGIWIKWSISTDNNFELVDFIAPSSGTYTIRVYRSGVGDQNESANKLGIAWVKDATYLPDLRNQSGYISYITLRNDGSQIRNVTVDYYDVNGVSTPKISDVCVLHPNQTCQINVNDLNRIPLNTRGSAIVGGSEDVSVVVENQHSSKVETYVGMPGNPSGSGIGIDDSIYIPAYYINYYGWSSTIYAQNTGTTQTTIDAYFYNDSGSQVDHNTYTVNANAQQAISLSGTTMGSVRIVAGQPLAVVVSHDHSLMSFSYVGVSDPGSKGYLPALFKNYYGWISSYQVQEVNGYSAYVSATYYPTGTKPPFSLSAHGHREVYMGAEGVSNGWHGAGMAYVSSGSGKVATAIHHTNTNVNGALGYHGFQAGAKTVALPHVKKDASWSASITVQNVGTNSTDVTVKFFNADGSERIADEHTFSLLAGRSQELYAEIPANFSGSVLVLSDYAEVVAVVHQAHTDGRHFGYGLP